MFICTWSMFRSHIAQSHEVYEQNYGLKLFLINDNHHKFKICIKMVIYGTLNGTGKFGLV